MSAISVDPCRHRPVELTDRGAPTHDAVLDDARCDDPATDECATGDDPIGTDHIGDDLLAADTVLQRQHDGLAHRSPAIAASIARLGVERLHQHDRQIDRFESVVPGRRCDIDRSARLTPSFITQTSGD